MDRVGVRSWRRITLPSPFRSLVSLGSRLVKPSSSPFVIARCSLSAGTGGGCIVSPDRSISFHLALPAFLLCRSRSCSFLILPLNFFECVHHFLSDGVGILPSLLQAGSLVLSEFFQSIGKVENIAESGTLYEAFGEHWQLFIANFLIDAPETSCSYRGRVTAIDQPVWDGAFQGFSFLLHELDGGGCQPGVDG